MHYNEIMAKSIITNILQEASRTLFNKEGEIKVALSGILSRGHLLLEDNPGMGKTTLVYLLGRLLGMTVHRIQFTNDLLPADILGTSVYDRDSGEFNFKKGPLFNEFILADELNRATPKTQSALLQAMEERRVSVEGREYPLDDNFLIVATQNPYQQVGTYPLPESQLDRFFMGLCMGAPKRSDEKRIIQGAQESPENLPVLLKKEELARWREEVAKVELRESVLDYMVDLLEASRAEFGEGALISPRSGKDLAQASRSHAFIDDRTFVIPEDVQAVIPAVLGHRVGAGRGVRYGQSKVLKLIESVSIP